MNANTKQIDIVTIQMVKESSLRSQYRTISEPKDVWSIVSPLVSQKDREHFGVICVDIKNQPTHIAIVSIGNINSSLVHPREVYKTAILSNSAYIILFHNHPSGNPEPSAADLDLTKRLVEAGTLMGIEVLDHIIVGDGERFLSMKELRLM